MRQLAYDGAPTDQMYAVDIANHFDIGYECFQDQDKFFARFMETGMFSDLPELQKLRGKMDVISISAVIHRWDWNGQVKAAKRVVEFSKPGSFVVGHQIGNVKAKEVKLPAAPVPLYRHNAESLTPFWDQVGKETDTVWEVKEARIFDFSFLGWDLKNEKWMDPDDRVIDWVVCRGQVA